MGKEHQIKLTHQESGEIGSKRLWVELRQDPVKMENWRRVRHEAMVAYHQDHLGPRSLRSEQNKERLERIAEVLGYSYEEFIDIPRIGSTTREEVDRVVSGDERASEVLKLRIIFHCLELASGYKIPDDYFVEKIQKLALHPATWRILAISSFPFYKSSDIQRYLFSSIYRMSINFARDQKRAEAKKKREDEDPLIQFFKSNPFDSEPSIRLLATLSLHESREREAFVQISNKKPRTEVAKSLSLSKAGLDHLYLRVRDKLKAVLSLPSTEWQVNDVLFLAKKLNETKYREVVENLSQDQRLLLKLRYEDDKRVDEIAKILGIDVNAAKARVFRLRRSLDKKFGSVVAQSL